VELGLHSVVWVEAVEQAHGSASRTFRDWIESAQVLDQIVYHFHVLAEQLAAQPLGSFPFVAIIVLRLTAGGAHAALLRLLGSEGDGHLVVAVEVAVVAAPIGRRIFWRAILMNCLVLTNCPFEGCRFFEQSDSPGS
jgi:hypothetical protein